MNHSLHLEEPERGAVHCSRTILIGSAVQDGPPSKEKEGLLLPGEGQKELTLTQEMLARGLLAVGATGAGKTNLIFSILSGVLERLGPEDAVLIFDAKQDFLKQFFNPANPNHLLISPLPQHRARTLAWNLFGELLPDGRTSSPPDELQGDILELAAALFSPLENQQQPFFHLAARDVFRMVLTGFLEEALRTGRTDTLSNDSLLRFLDGSTTETLLDLAGPKFGYLRSYLGTPGSATPQSLGVEGTLHAMTASQFFGIFRNPAGQGSFAMRQLVRSKGGRVIFVEHDLSRSEALGPVLSVLFDLAVKEQLAGGQGNLYLFLDELSVMPCIRKLVDACNLGRSRGLKTVVGLQSVKMLQDHYGQARADSILAGFVNAVCFRAVDAATREYISGRFGRTFELLPYGGVYIQHDGNAVSDADIRALQTGEGFCDLFGTAPFRMRFAQFQQRRDHACLTG